jgi:hypothetical protein
MSAVVETTRDFHGASQLRKPHMPSYDLGFADGAVDGEVGALRRLVERLRDGERYRAWVSGYAHTDRLRQFRTAPELTARYIEETMLEPAGR